MTHLTLQHIFAFFLFINLEIVLEREFNLMSWISRFMEKLYLVEPHHKKKIE